MFNYFFNGVLTLINNGQDKYILSENKFIKSYKMDFQDFIFYIIGNRGKTTVLELYDYFKVKYKDILGRISMIPTKQNFSQRRMYIDPRFFKDATNMAVKEMYLNEKDFLSKYKGFYQLNIDGSQVKLPNTLQTREEFSVDSLSLNEIKTPKARISVLSDAKNEFILDSELSDLSVGESVLAFKHIEKADEIIDLTQSIIVFDRNYASVELIMQLLLKNSHFIFRLSKNKYKKERKHMKSDDEWIDLNLNKSRTKNIKNNEIRQKAEELDSLNLRIVNIPLKTGEIETLLTNIPYELATPEELKELYGERWQIETGYDVLKNKLQIENFSGKKKITIEQDFYSQILMYNIVIEYKTDLNQKLWEKNKNKDNIYKYKVNMNILIGHLKTFIYELFLTPSKKKQKLIKKEIEKIAQKNLIKTKNKQSQPRKQNPLAQKHPYNNRKLF
ncbi:MAG: IS4 family transposase [Methanobrevibacter sp.]|nr:IS4 family transposase [Candidatus Methanoflexus mossambicus]